MDGGQTAAAVVPKTDPLAGLNPRERELVEQTLRDYPQLTVEKAIQVLTEFGGL